MRTPWMCGNWKMFKSLGEAETFFAEFLGLVEDVGDVEIGIAAPYTLLQTSAQCVKGSRVMVGAQNVHWEDEGAFTAEVSGAMLREVGCTFALVGHSERRQYFGETDEIVGKRGAKALEKGLTPIICVGETLEQREAGDELSVVKRQVKIALSELDGSPAEKIAVAYEPVWAIGTGRTATPAQAQQMHAHIRAVVTELWGMDAASKLRILYGGSVKPDNVVEIMSGEDVDGALVGGASINAKSFASIVRFRV